jgi:hypothetical protein
MVFHSIGLDAAPSRRYHRRMQEFEERLYRAFSNALEAALSAGPGAGEEGSNPALVLNYQASISLTAPNRWNPPLPRHPRSITLSARLKTPENAYPHTDGGFSAKRFSS